MKYGIQRKINLGKYGIEYEALDLIVTEADSWEEAEKAINEEREKVHKLLIPLAKARYEKLSKKEKLTFKESEERDNLKESIKIAPF